MIYATLVYPLLCSRTTVVLYIDELALNMTTFQRKRHSNTYKEIRDDNPNEYVSCMVAATSEGI